MSTDRLDGFAVGITADRRWEEQAELLRRRGARVLHGPTIKTHSISAHGNLTDVTQQLIDAPPDVLIASTGIGVRSWFAAAESWGAEEALHAAMSAARIYARGPKTASALHLLGLDVFATAATEQMSELVAGVVDRGVDGKVVALQLDGGECAQSVRDLESAGAEVVAVPVYRWTLPGDLRPAEQLVRAAVDGALQAITFTSAAAGRNAFVVAADIGVGDAFRDALNGPVLAVAVGPVCAASLLDAGVEAPVVPPSHRLGSMIRTLSEQLVRRTCRSTIVGQPVHLLGRVAHVGDLQVELSVREAAVLATLLGAAPRVVSRADLLAQVWDRATDPHVVDVTVARLRKRLGSAAGGIVAVPRRGYMLRT